MNQEQCACWPKNPNDIACKHYIAAIAYPMNQDNQVGWEKDFFERWGRSGLWARETGKAYNTGDGISNVYTTDVLRDVHYFIAAVAQDSYAEGIRRAMRVANSHVCGKDGHNCAYEIFAQLEKEVKK